MGIQFILGGSGSGKSTYLADLIISESIAHPQKKYLVLVPEQYTLRTQQMYIRRHPRHGILNIDVLSFERLAYRVLSEAGEDSRGILYDTGKSLLLRSIVSNMQDELPVFGRNFRKIGYVGEMKSLLSELAQYRVDDARLVEVKDRCSASLQAKLSDVQKIRNAYHEALEETYLTSEELMECLIRHAGTSELLSGAVIACDGFTGFTPVQERFLEEVMDAAEELYVTATIDLREELFHDKGPQGLFHLSQAMLVRLRQAASEKKVVLREPVCLKDYPRFAQSRELGFLEATMFRSCTDVWAEETTQISLHQNRNPREEAAFTASEILRLVREEGVRFREIAVIPGSMDPYGQFLSDAFRERNIPFFLDEKRDVLQNICIEYARSAVALVEERYSFESMFRFLKCGLHNIEQADLYLLENYCLAMGVRGFKRWQERFVRPSKHMSEEELQRVEALRAKLMEELGPFTEALRKRNRTVRSVTTALYELLVSQSIQEKLSVWQDSFEAEGDLSLAREYAQIYKALIGLFDQMVLLLGDEAVSLKEYRELFDAGLSDIRVGITPPSADQVLIGDLERTRLDRIGYLFAIGMNEKNLPGIGQKAGILNDRDRMQLAERGIRLAPTVDERTLIQRFYVYLSFTRPDRHLYLSYCNVGMDGKSQRPTYYLREIRRRFPRLCTVRETVREEIRDLATDRSCACSYLARNLSGGGADRTPEADASWKELYAWYSQSEAGRRELSLLLDGHFAHDPKEALTAEAAQSLYGKILKASVTKLETFARCPYAFFLTYGLKLQERDLYGFELLDEGSVMHQALYYYGCELKKRKLDWREVSEELQNELVGQVLDRAITELASTALSDTARQAYQAARMKETLSCSVWALTKQLEAGGYIPAAFELPIGSGDIPAREILLSSDRVMQLRGKIDRVDLCREDKRTYVKILDYKTGTKTMDLSAVYHGLDLQLFVYLKMAAQYAEKIAPEQICEPAGVLYYHVQNPMLKNSEVVKMSDSARAGMTEQEVLDTLRLKALRPEGVCNEAREVLNTFDRAFPEDVQESLAIPVKVKKDGSFYQGVQLLNADEFELMDRHLEAGLRKTGDEILSGNIAITPVRHKKQHGCEYCRYQRICGFDAALPGFRERALQELDIDTIRLRLHAQDAGQDGTIL